MKFEIPSPPPSETIKKVRALKEMMQRNLNRRDSIRKGDTGYYQVEDMQSDDLLAIAQLCEDLLKENERSKVIINGLMLAGSFGSWKSSELAYKQAEEFLQAHETTNKAK